MSKLVIGAGYLGLRVAQRWREAGETVFVTTRKPDRAEEFARAGFQPILCDVLSPPTLPAVDGLVYCVGLDRAAGVPMRRVYVEGLTNVLATLPGQPRFIHVSSTSVYGQVSGEWVDEMAETDPQEQSGQIVLEAERLLRQARPDAVVLRFAGIYGPGRLIRAAAIRAGEAIATDADKWLNLIHVEDGANAVVTAEARGMAGTTVNVVDDRPVRRRDFYTCLARLLNAPPPRFLPPGEPLPPHERTNRRISNDRLHRELGVELRYPDYERGLSAAVLAEG